jgi:hypothetical protein
VENVGRSIVMKYTSRGLRRRRDSDKWEVMLSHKDPLTGDLVATYHTITAKTPKAAARARDKLILEMEREGGTKGSKTTIREYMEKFLAEKEASGTIEPSTVRGYNNDNKLICRHLGDIRLSDLTIAQVNRWMSDLTAAGYTFDVYCQALADKIGVMISTLSAFCVPTAFPTSEICQA